MTDPARFPLSMSPQNHAPRPLRVGLIVDWERQQRGVFWRDLLEEAAARSARAISVTEYRLADATSATRPKALDPAKTPDAFVDATQLRLSHCDVLVINWDAVNGDPDFGSDYACRWFAHRRPELYNWIDRGGILIMEGQTAMNIPAQEAYDAVLGTGEVKVCGAVSELHPLLQADRCGRKCKYSERARTSDVFKGLVDLEPGRQNQYHDMFPNRDNSTVSPSLKDVHWDMLYRGWFRRRPLTWLLRSTRFTWVPVLLTADADKREHPTMLVANHGTGAMFATTMMLASSQQVALIEKLLNTHGNTARLPLPSKGVERALQVIRDHVLPIAILMLFASNWTLNTPQSSVVRLGAVVASFVASWAVVKYAKKGWHWIRAILGY